MTEEVLTDDQSHYEVSLTAGQAFLAFVLLLLSLAASFAFGLLLGRGQGDERLSARKQEPAVVNEASVPGKASVRATEVAVKDDDFKQAAPPAAITEETTVASSTVPAAAPVKTALAPVARRSEARGPRPEASPAGPRPEASVPHFAQLLSTSDQKTAELFAARLIDGGFTSSYVERIVTEKGTVYRVRTRFPSEQEARAAEAKLKTFSKDVWITK